MNVGSLFSGIGGIELGFEKAGFETVWFIEKDRYAQAVIRKHWGRNAIVYDDITKVDFRAIPKVDILTGGFPCQDISSCGKRIGISGSQSSLWKYYKEAIRILRPKYAFIENVSILTGRGLNVVLADIAEVGYDAEWYCLPASSVGAPHQRNRTFIIAYTKCNGCIGIGQQMEKRCNSEQVNVTLSKSSNVSDTIRKRLERKKRKGIQNKHYRKFTRCDYNWKTEPDLGRVADGVPCRVDRIRCLGNAVVPQVAEVFAKAIKEFEEERVKQSDVL